MENYFLYRESWLRICDGFWKMDGQEFIDIIVFLPQEIWENILFMLLEEPLYNEDFQNCRLVCKNWNERISSNSQLWKVACQKLGLNVRNATEYKSIFLRMRKKLRIMKSGGEVFCVENILSPHITSLIYYHSGIVAFGSSRYIYKLKLEPILSVLSEADIGRHDCVWNIRFDETYLVVGTTLGYVITYKMPTMERLYTRTSLAGHISCLTFDKDIDVLITASKGIVTFRCLSSGTVYFTRTIPNNFYTIDMHLIPTSDLQCGCDYMLLCISSDSCCRFLFDSQQITTTKMNLFPIGHYNWNPIYYSWSHSCFINPFLYFFRCLENPQISILLKYDTVSGSFEEKGRFNCIAMHLVGVGNKYACLLLEKHLEPYIFIIYDLAKESEVARFDLPSQGIGQFRDVRTCLVNGGFLDGFDGFNHKGVILVIRNEISTYVLKWRE